MKLLKTLSFSLLMLTALATQAIHPENKPQSLKFLNYPDKTICIKHPAAENATNFFAGSMVYNFEIYKAGNLDNILQSMLQNKDVATCTAGKVTGDYSAVILTLKSVKDKAWFIALFKKAGLSSIKINNNEVMALDKL